MAKIFNLSLMILCAVLLHGMVLAFDDDSESSSDLHIRHKRMDPAAPAAPGSSPSHQLPPFLAYNLREVKITSPTVVVITRNGNIFGTGYAIHPYLVLTASVFARPQYVIGVSVRNRFGEGHIAQRIQLCKEDPTRGYVIIQLKDPIFLDEPVLGAFPAAKVPESATNWAYHEATQWIIGMMPHMRPLLGQNLNNLYFNNPTKLHITSSDRPAPGNAYAVHPYIAITRPEFMGRNASVVSYIEPTGQPHPHRIQFRYTNRALNVEVIELLDPVLIRNHGAGALAANHYSSHAIAWARSRAEEWKRTRLNQRNYYQENAA